MVMWFDSETSNIAIKTVKHTFMKS